MKKYIFAIIFISTLNLFSMEYDLDVITLPYDSLNIEDIVVSNFTILARSDNTIYKSTDDGENWKIAFESDLKVNQLYSKDPHTILLVGEKGMVYRTMDYGETWLDESVDTDSTLIKVAARNYQDYIALAETRWLYHKFSPDKEWLAVNTRAAVYLSTLIEYQDSYYYGGGFLESDESRGNDHIYNFSQPRYKYTFGEIISSDPINKIFSTNKSQRDKYRTDSLNLLTSNNIQYITVMRNGFSAISSYDILVLELVPILSIKNKVTGILNSNDTVYVFGRSGEIVVAKESEFGVSYKTEIERKELGFNVNAIVSKENKTIYLASNNSRIYKMSIYEPVSSIQVETNNLIKQYNDVIWIDDKVEIIGVYNYIGQKLNVTKISNNYLEFKQGIYYLSFKHKNKIYNHKIMVN